MVNLGTESGKVMIKVVRRACAWQTLPLGSGTIKQSPAVKAGPSLPTLGIEGFARVIVTQLV